jgi:hypothetical protein
MRIGLTALLTAALLGALNAEEVRTLTAKGFVLNSAWHQGYSESVTLQAGEWLQVIGNSVIGRLEVTINGEVFAFEMVTQSSVTGSVAPSMAFAGPVEVRLTNGGPNPNQSFATLAIHRVNSPTTPAAVPAEPGQNFAVVMESSSDLITWTPAAPGTYSGTDPKRFFRVRIDRE